ncbi:MAG: hypothetical protein ACLP05_02580 [Candidatus Kryptoniota bacterium]
MIFLSKTGEAAVWSDGTKGQAPTNYEVLNSQIGTVADSIVSILVQYHRAVVSYKPVMIGFQEIDNFARQRIEEHLLESKIRVTMDSSLTAASLKVTVPLVQITYSAPISSHIFKSSEVVRTIRSAYDIEMADSGEIEFAKSYSVSFSDTVEQSRIPDLEMGSYEFLHGSSDPAGLLETILQPLVFVASAAIIVYLFFTIRGS